MKTKLITTLILFSFVALAICSCSTSNNKETDCLKYIYEVDNGAYDSNGETLNRRNLIFDTSESFFDSNASKTKVVTINHIEYNLEYDESLHYPVGDRTVDSYLVEGKEDQKILMNKDGSLYAVLFSFEKPDLPMTASAKEICSLLEVKLKEMIDLTKYQHVRMPKDEGGIYDFLYYNSIDGYMTDFTKFSVMKKENTWEIISLAINDLGIDNLDFRIDKEKKQELLTAKLKDIYTTDTTEYKSYDELFPPKVVMYEDEMYIMYYVAANYIDSLRGEEKTAGWLHQILIPLHLINMNTK